MSILLSFPRKFLPTTHTTSGRSSQRTWTLWRIFATMRQAASGSESWQLRTSLGTVTPGLWSVPLGWITMYWAPMMSSPDGGGGVQMDAAVCVYRLGLD